MVKLCTGRSSHRDAEAAAEEAIGEALRGAKNAVFALVFSTDQYDAATLAAAVSRRLGDLPWAGCCTAGVFTAEGLLIQGLVVGILYSKDLRVGLGVAGPLSHNPKQAGQTAMSQALRRLDAAGPARHRAYIVLPDALTCNAAEAVRGAAQEAGTSGAWSGGGAGDNLRFIKTAQFAEGRAWNDHVVIAALDSARPMGLGIEHGWTAYGKQVMVTMSRGSVAIELDYQKAVGVYQALARERGYELTRETFGAFAMLHPLGIPQADGGHIIRDPLKIEDDGSLAFAGEMPRGSFVRLMDGDQKRLLDAAESAAAQARRAVKGALGGAIVFDCVSRSLILQKGMREELDRFQAALGTRVPLIGCLAFGEVGAPAARMPQFQNKTSVVLALPGRRAPFTPVRPSPHTKKRKFSTA